MRCKHENDIVAWNMLSDVLSSSEVVIDGQIINKVDSKNSFLISDSNLWNSTVSNFNYLQALDQFL